MPILRKVRPFAADVTFSDDVFRVRLADGREISTPLAWFPRLSNATPEQRADWELIGGGIGIHWPAIDEDISVESLLSVKPRMIANPRIAESKGFSGRRGAK